MTQSMQQSAFVWPEVCLPGTTSSATIIKSEVVKTLN